MIVHFVFIALLMCSGVQADRMISECDTTWVCFAPKSCLTSGTRKYIDIFYYNDSVKDDCVGIVMIRPTPNNRWLVALESWHPSATYVKVVQESKELFSCKKNGPKSVATSTIAGFNELQPFSNRRISCQFWIGDGTNEVISKKNVNIGIVSDASTEEIERSDQFLLRKIEIFPLTCDFTHVLFESESSTEELVNATFVGDSSATCTDPSFKLQYKSVSGYEDVTKSEISCAYNSTSRKYNYEVETKAGKKSLTGEFHARCFAKVSSFCTKPLTPAGKIEPQFTNYETDYNSKTLACPKFFKVDGEVYREKAVCRKIEENEFKWTIGNATVNNATEVECVEKMPCIQKIVGCTGDCKLNVTTGMPYCPKSHNLSVIIDGKDPINIVSVHCDTDKGTLFYEGEAKGYLPFDMRGVSFNCTDMTPPDVAFYRQPWFERTYDVLGVLAGILSVAIIVYMIWAIPRFHREKRAREAKETIKESSNKRFLKISDR